MNIAIVDDSDADAQSLIGYLDAFEAERGLAHRKRPPTEAGGLSNSWCGRKDLNLHEIALIRT